MRKTLIIGFVILFICGFFPHIFSLVYYINVSRQIESVESFELMWDASIMSHEVLIDSCRPNDHKTFIALDANRNDLIIPTHDGFLNTRTSLTNFDLSTGEINWQTRLNTNITALGINDHNVFSVIRDEEMCTPAPGTGYCDAVEIISYAPDSGEKVWTVYNHNMNSASILCINNEVISIEGYPTRPESGDREEITLVVDTGEQLSKDDLKFPGMSTYEGGSYFSDWNLVQLGFEIENIISYEQNDNILFFLTKDENTLWAVDSNPSEIVGRVQFDGEPFRPSYYGFQISSDDNMVAVYLKDSRQLFVFRFTP